MAELDDAVRTVRSKTLAAAVALEVDPAVSLRAAVEALGSVADSLTYLRQVMRAIEATEGLEKRMAGLERRMIAVEDCR